MFEVELGVVPFWVGGPVVPRNLERRIVFVVDSANRAVETRVLAFPEHVDPVTFVELVPVVVDERRG